MARAFGSYPECHWFESSRRYLLILHGFLRGSCAIFLCINRVHFENRGYRTKRVDTLHVLLPFFERKVIYFIAFRVSKHTLLSDVILPKPFSFIQNKNVENSSFCSFFIEFLQQIWYIYTWKEQYQNHIWDLFFPIINLEVYS